MAGLQIDESREMDGATRRTFGKLKRSLDRSGTDAERLALNTSALAVPTRFFDPTNKRDWLWDGSGWMILSEPVVTTFVPSISPSAGTITALGGVAWFYTRSLGFVDYWASINITTAGTAAGAGLISTLPIVQDTSEIAMGHGRENAVTGHMMFVVSNGAGFCYMGYMDNAGPIATNANITVAGRYRMGNKYS